MIRVILGIVLGAVLTVEGLAIYFQPKCVGSIVSTHHSTCILWSTK